jgi:hypothetical protein
MSVSEAPKIVTLNVLDIKPYWRNPRENHEAVQKVKHSIELYGYNQLIAVDQKNVIIAGHTRYLALRVLGWAHIPVQVLDLDDRQAKAYRIIDNKTSEFAKWDGGLLLTELKELGDDLPSLQPFFREPLPFLEAGLIRLEAPAPVLRPGSDSELYRQSEKEVACPHCGESMYIAEIK